MTLAIQSPEGEHLGFILMSLPSFQDADGTFEGDCIFTILPAKAELMDSPLVDTLWLYHFKSSGEHKAKLTVNGKNISAFITPLAENPLKLAFERNGAGTLWRLPDETTPIA